MLKNDTNPTCGLLYIDDEEKALKYFKMAFSAKYNVFTAESGKSGLEILEREGNNIGIVISDQRMPEMQGAEVLEIIRENFPRIVRILATAYSDLESAIQAVNKGYIYQYVVKPWDVTELGMVLQRAADYHNVLVERDELLSLKMTTLQRIICSDRLKWLLLSSRYWEKASQIAFRRALVAFVAALPHPLRPVVSGEKSGMRNFELSTLLRSEYSNAVKCLNSIEILKQDPSPTPSSEPIPNSLTEKLGIFASSAEKDKKWRLTAVEYLKAFLAALLQNYRLDPNQIDLTCHEGSSAGLVVHLRSSDTAFSSSELAKNLFGLLLMEETPPLSLLLFEILVAFAQNNGSLIITVEESEPNKEPLMLRFSFASDSPDSPEIAIDHLAEKFASWDISEL